MLLAFPSSVHDLTNPSLLDIHSDSNPLRLLHHRYETVNPFLLQSSLPLPDLPRGLSHHWDYLHSLVGGLDAHGFPPLPTFCLQLGSLNTQRPLRQ